MTWGTIFETCKDDCALGKNLKDLEQKENNFCLILTDSNYSTYLNNKYTKIGETGDSIINENYYLYKYNNN